DAGGGWRACALPGLGLAVNPLQLPLPRITNEWLPQTFRIADNDSVCVMQRFLGQEGRMIPAEDDAHTTLAEIARQLVGPASRVGLDGHGNKAGILVERDTLQAF